MSMREIEFRGKRIDTGKWIFGFLAFIYVNGRDENGFIFLDTASIYCQEEAQSYDVQTETIGQYTGLKDQKGVKIFEGDVLKDPQGNTGKVFWHISGAYFAVNWKRKDGSYETDTCLGYGEVIGNIYDKPKDGKYGQK